jgi:hypothetical protein
MASSHLGKRKLITEEEKRPDEPKEAKVDVGQLLPWQQALDEGLDRFPKVLRALISEYLVERYYCRGLHCDSRQFIGIKVSDKCEGEWKSCLCNVYLATHTYVRGVCHGLATLFSRDYNGLIYRATFDNGVEQGVVYSVEQWSTLERRTYRDGWLVKWDHTPLEDGEIIPDD